MKTGEFRELVDAAIESPLSNLFEFAGDTDAQEYFQRICDCDDEALQTAFMGGLIMGLTALRG